MKKEMQRIRREDYAVYVIEENVPSIGYLTMCEGTQVILQSSYILPEYQGYGIGRMAISFAKACFGKTGRNEFEFICFCHSDNQGARTLYEIMGGMIVEFDADNEEHW